MNDIAFQIWLTIAGTVAGAVLSLVIPVVTDAYRYRKRPGLLGDWKSIYQLVYESGRPWQQEDIRIDLFLGQLRLKNCNDIIVLNKVDKRFPPLYRNSTII